MPSDLRLAIMAKVHSYHSAPLDLTSLGAMIADAIELAMYWKHEPTTDEVTR